jgi:hypothetical protein
LFYTYPRNKPHVELKYFLIFVQGAIATGEGRGHYMLEIIIFANPKEKTYAK